MEDGDDLRSGNEKPDGGTESLTALTMAGFDPSSGAGVTADVLTFAAHGVFATAAITALTVQSTRGVEAVHAVEPEVLRATLHCLEADLPPVGIKIGMLGSAALVQVVAEYVDAVRRRRAVTVVLDPVLRSSSGTSLLRGAGQHPLLALLPLVDAVTPNLAEAAVLTGLPCTEPADMEKCALALRRQYPTLQVILTGGHLHQPADLLADAEGLHWFDGAHLQTTSTHGTGCAFSAALLAGRLHGAGWAKATAAAKEFVRQAMQQAVPHGNGCGPLALVPQLGRQWDKSVTG